VHITLKPEVSNEQVPHEWEEIEKKAMPANAQSVPFRNFSTGLHRVESGVVYKLSSIDADETL
jgi:hypothetical protein